MGNFFGTPEVENQPRRVVTQQECYNLFTSENYGASSRIGAINHNRNYDASSRIGATNYRNIKMEKANKSRKRNKLNVIEPVSKSSITFILKYINSYAQEMYWDDRDYSEQSCYLINLDTYTSEYKEVENSFKSTNKRCFQVERIQRIQNPFLLAAFLLKQEEMEERIGEQSIEELFHGTRRENVVKICTNNLDWRLYGQNVGNKFGHGISFTPISNYATYYTNEECNNRVMLLVHVLVGSECIGRPNMVLPDEGTDTSVKENRQVIVKYEDNEFYPAYKITYVCTDPVELIQRDLNLPNRVHKQKRRGKSSRK